MNNFISILTSINQILLPFSWIITIMMICKALNKIDEQVRRNTTFLIDILEHLKMVKVITKEEWREWEKWEKINKNKLKED